jgi:uncharacterized membrane protein YfcA
VDALIAYLVLGALAGTLAGLLGIGGGLVIVPVLAWTFLADGFPGDLSMQAAVGTSLATIVVTSISSVLAHHRHGAVLWPVFAILAPGVLAGALLGALAAHVMASDALRILFGIFELSVAVQMGLGLRPAPHRELPGRMLMAAVGTVIGLISALVGIGGGTMTVPYLVWSNIPVRNAVATSAAVGLPIAIAGATGFVVTGLGSAMPAGSIGYVYLPAFAGIIVTSALFAPVGARLAHRLPTQVLKRVFAVFLAVVGVKMVVG